MLKFLYVFQNQDLLLVEVKRLDLPSTSAPQDLYYWLLVDKNKVLRLDFEAMDQQDGKNHRKFVQGELVFDDQLATLTILGREILFPNVKAELDNATKDLVWSFISFEHSFLRHLKPADVSYFKSWIKDSEVIRFSMTKFHLMKTEDELKSWWLDTLRDPKSLSLGIMDPVTKELIGYAGIAGINELDRNGEFYIFIGNKHFWNRGIGTSVTREIIRIGFEVLNLHRIFLTASSLNAGGLKAYERAGFKYEGRMREAFYRENTYSDKIIMGLLKEEWSN